METVAYFSMEFGVDPDVKTYSGGLGVLAGDVMKAAADRGIPTIGIGILPRTGYFTQRIENGQQVPYYENWDREMLPEGPTVRVKIGDRDVTAASRRYDVSGIRMTNPLYLLDTDCPENHPDDRTIMHHLYDNLNKLRQEAVIAKAGMMLLETLGHDPVSTRTHLNEGHAAFVVLEKLRRAGNIERVRETTTFTTHSLVAGHDEFDYRDAEHALNGLLPGNIREMAGHDRLSMTALAFYGSGRINAVSKKHGSEARNWYHRNDIFSITNGVHSSWASPEFQRLYDEKAPGWKEDSTLLGRAKFMPAEVAAAHRAAKLRMIDYVADKSGTRLDPDTDTIGWARRIVPYKRCWLLFSDMPRLINIVKGRGQVILAGKANPNYEAAKNELAYAIACGEHLKRSGVPFVFLENYGMRDAEMLTAGCDIWLNTPRKPFEASGTSGMDAALNGVPHLSTLDGWWPEGHEEGVTGWAIGDETSDDARDADTLYKQLDGLLGKDRAGVMCGAIRNGGEFNTNNRIREYAKVWGFS